MRRFLIAACMVFAALAAQAETLKLVGGSADKFILVQMIGTDGAAETGLAYTDMTITWTANTGSADTDVTEATMTMGTHADGGWIEIDATNSPGLYQFGIPDEAIADGPDYVVFSFKAAACVPMFKTVELIDVNLRDAVRLGLTSLPNAAAAAAGGLPVSTAGGLNLDAQAASVSAIEADTNEIQANQNWNVWDDGTRTLTAGTNIALAKGTGITGFNDLSAAAVNAEADQAIVDAKLDHLVAVADSDDVADNSIMAKLAAADGDWSSYNYASESLGPIREMAGDNNFLLGLINIAISNANDAIGIVDGIVDEILLDTAAVDTDNELRTRLTGGTGALSTVTTVQVNAEVDQGLADYDGPTKAEQDAAFEEIKGATFSTTTDQLEDLRDRGDAAWLTATGFPSSGDYTTERAAKLDQLDAAVSTRLATAGYTTPPTAVAIRQEIDSNSAQLAALIIDTGTDIPALIAALNNLSQAQAQSAAAAALTAYDPPTKTELDTAEGNIRGADSDTLKTISDQVDGVGGGGEVTVGDITPAALAKFVSDDTGESTAADGSVAKISQGAAGGNVTVGGFTQAALAEMVNTDTGETEIVDGSVAELMGRSILGTGTTAVHSGYDGNDWRTTRNGVGVSGVTLTFYLASEYDAQPQILQPRARVTTSDGGAWAYAWLYQDLEYVVVAFKGGPNGFGPNTFRITP